MALPDHFEGEDVIITFEKEYDSTLDTGWTAATAIKNVEGKVLSWNKSGGAAPTEDVYAFGGKTFNFAKPREKFSLSFEVMLNSTDFSFINSGGNTSAKIGANNKLVTSADTTKRWRVIFWFQNSSYHIKNTTSPTIVVPSKTQSVYRLICVDVKAVSFDLDFSADSYAKGTLTLEFSATDSSGYPNLIEQEGLFTGTASTKLHSMVSSTTTGIMAKSRGYLTYVATAATAAWTAGTTSTRYRIG